MLQNGRICCNILCVRVRTNFANGGLIVAVKTTNGYGTINISNNAIALLTGHVARECYGVVDLVSRSVMDYVKPFLRHQPLAKGVKVKAMGNRLVIDLRVVLKYGVNARAVSESLKKSIKYRIEQFTGMIIDSVNVYVVGVRV